MPLVNSTENAYWALRNMVWLLKGDGVRKKLRHHEQAVAR